MSGAFAERSARLRGRAAHVHQTAIEFDLSPPEDPWAFERLLAREQGWSEMHARRVVMEYRCYMVLRAAADLPLAPSRDVELAWELHLAQTRNYARFCDTVFASMQAHPIRSADPEDDVPGYALTLELYREVFQCEPPDAAWPSLGQWMYDTTRRTDRPMASSSAVTQDADVDDAAPELGRDDACIALVARLDDLPLELEASLAASNAWTLGYAVQVVREYRRFLALVHATAQPLCAPPDIELAWRLHLTFTAEYAGFCDAAFGRFLHHDALAPLTAGDAVLADRRAAARAQYARTFGVSAPAPVWTYRPRPDPMPSGRAPWGLPWFLPPGMPLLIVVLAAATALACWLDDTELLWRLTTASEWAFWPAFVVAYAVPWAVASWQGDIRAAGNTPGVDPRAVLDPWEAAWLSGGARRMVAVVMAMQVHRGEALLVPVPPSAGGMPRAPVWRVLRRAADEGPVEAEVMTALHQGEVKAKAAVRAVAPLARAIGERLQRLGLAQRESTFGHRRAGMLAFHGLALTLVLARIPHLFRQRDDAFLWEGLLALGLAAIASHACRPAERLTPAGRAALRPLDEAAMVTSLARARALGETPVRERSGLAATLPLAPQTVAVFARAATVDDPRFEHAHLLWFEAGLFGAWQGNGEVRSIHDDGSD